MSQSCEFGLFQDKALLIQFVCGIKCSRTQNHILNDGKITTFDKATVVATIMELTNNDVNILRNNNSEGNINIINSHRQCKGSRREYQEKTASKERNVKGNDQHRYNKKQKIQ